MRKKIFLRNHVWQQILTRLTVMIILQYVQILDHYVIHLKLI